MTPRKELYIALRDALAAIPEVELTDLDRGQYADPEGSYPTQYTAALVRINRIDYTTAIENGQDGTVSVDINLYCKDGWMDQHASTADPDGGLMEIDLLDTVTDAVQYLEGDRFGKLEQVGEESNDPLPGGIMWYTATFSCKIYKKTKYAFAKARLNIQS